ncbi:MAG: hypothetical protein JXR31_17110 [Prolixibacteraceae bacterium]|nr:hypothetical protein [Prolixibacteraceae bacterium]
MKLYKVKTRLILSVVIGLIAVLIYNSLLAEVKPTNIIGISNFLNSLWKRIPEIQVFLFCSVLSLALISIPLLFKKQNIKQVIIPVVIGVALVIITGRIEFQLRQKKLGFNNLDAVQVIDLYEKVSKEGDIAAISKIAVHPNLPDSIQEKLSDSEFMEIRRNISYETNSKEILIKLSSDKEWEVRLAVATNKLTPIEIIHNLQIDKNEDVRNIANSMIQKRK